MGGVGKARRLSRIRDDGYDARRPGIRAASPVGVPFGGMQDIRQGKVEIYFDRFSLNDDESKRQDGNLENIQPLEPV